MKIFGKIPVSMSLSFWVVAALIGYFNTKSLIGTLIWICVIFISVLVHELGHALVAYKLGLSPRIELVAFGGLTHYLGKNLSLGKQFFIVFMGPLFGFFLFLASFFVLHTVHFQNVLLMQSLGLLQMINLFWTVANFIPVLPLDGGHILRIGLEAYFKSKGRYYALFISMLVALLASIVFFFYQIILFGAFLFLFAYQNYTDWKNEKDSFSQEGSEDLRSRFTKAEESLLLGNKEEAFEGFRSILRSSSVGSIAALAAQYIAFSEYEQGQKEKAFEILLPKRKDLSKEGVYLLHKIAFELGKYAIVTELSEACFQAFPLPEVSERAAKSHAHQGQVDACLGWLETTLSLGVLRSLDLISDVIFDSIRDRSAFTKWVKSNLS